MPCWPIQATGVEHGLPGSLQVLAADAKAPEGCPVSLIDETTTVYMLLGSGDVDHAKELEKHLKEQVCTPECIGPEIELPMGTSS